MARPSSLLRSDRDVRRRQSPSERNFSVAGRRPVPYLSRMLIRAAVLALPLVACGFASDPASAVSEPTAEVDQAVINACDPKDTPCDPFDRDASAVCQEPDGAAPLCAGVPAVSPR